MIGGLLGGGIHTVCFKRGYREGDEAGGLAREVFAAGGDGEFAVFDAFGGYQFVGDFLDRAGLSSDDEDFEAIVVVEVDVEGGNDDLVMVVLDVGKRRLDVLFVVVVKEGDGAGDFLGAEVLAMFDERLAHLVGDGQRTVLVALLLDHFVKLAQQVARDRDGEPLNQFVFHIIKSRKQS